ncbi:substrate-binding domain-containing protein [Actinoplanes sp. NBRC 103695]|uniref:LacI family DNA-binding transcriptional regulator n=1 Tax=Actinoplanes sp. NBRC 103695 TaxID=3032202 RepID=UPI0024A224C1|nr:substrate-binding domain-containing protein [Actinoplanes sp. NBRC 103695]GLZ00440.1 LacI family transcriptional regulator [Actinoplanes sp. NBRC 103695]
MSPPRLVGMVLTDSAAQVGVEPFFMELIGGMEQALAPTGTSVLLLVVPDLAAELATYRRWAAERTVAAVVVVNLVHDDGRPAELATAGLPAVLAGRYAGPATFTSVITDDAGAMTAAVRLLHSLGHRIVGRVSGPAELVHTAERSTAMHEAARGLGVEVRIVEADYSADLGVFAARELLAAADPPTAVIFDNDVMAVAAEADLVRAGVRVPGQVSLLACDDSALCELAVPPLSAMSTDVHDHGVTIGVAVLDVLNGAPRREHFGPTIRILTRDSTGPAPQRI